MSQPLRTRTFVYTTDQKRKLTGWKPEGADDQFYPGPGHLVYHDTVEHFGNSEGWDRELLAFGATMYGRMHYDPQMTAVNAQDFVGFFSRDQKYIVPPCKPQYYTKKLPEKAEGFLGVFMDFIKEEIHNRQDMLYCVVNNTDFFQPPYGKAELKQNLANAEAWFRRGWCIANRLHHGQDFNKILHMMTKLTDSVNSLTEQMHPNIGDKMTVSVNRADSTFNIALA